ncbi:MAG: acyltransferase [Pseudomonadota bacterium]
METRTLQEIWDDGAARRNNFDAIRLGAASLVVFSHSFEITGGIGAFEPLMALTGGQASFGRVAVLVFFVLSGFLIAKSWRADPRLQAFAAKRALRIFPALFVVVLIGVFLVGPLLSASGARAYFASAETWSYLANLGFYSKHASLPGVFADAPIAGVVNGPLWTLKFEVACYAAVAGLGAFGRLDRRSCLAALLFAYSVHYFGGDSVHGGVAYYIFGAADLGRAFFTGAVIALYADELPLDWRLGASAALGLVAAGAIGGFDALFPLLGGYLVFCIAFADCGAAARIGRYGDFSYGVYVWGFPVQQVALTAGATLWYANFFVALPVTLLIAAASWRWIEAPALRLKPKRVPREVEDAHRRSVDIDRGATPAPAR